MPTATWHTPSSFEIGRHSQWWSSMLHLMHLQAQLNRQLLFGICTSKSESCWMNLSSLWPTTVWLQILLCPYQLIVDCCNLFGCNAGAVVLCACCQVTIIVAITIIVIVMWVWHLDAFNCLITLILALGVMFGICSCMTRQRKSAIAQGLSRKSFAPSDISRAWIVTSLLLFFPTKGNLWYKGWLLWWLWSQTWLSSCSTLGTPKIGGNQCWHDLSN